MSSRKKSRKQKKQKKQKTFPEQLGPFGIVKTSFGAPHINVYSVFDLYEMGASAFHSQNLKYLLGCGIDFPVVAQMSPSHPITLDSVSKKAAGIPLEAASFVWSYPSTTDFDEVRRKSRNLDFTDADVCFLTIGGYIYFDAKGTICGVNTLTPAASGGLQFSDPQHFSHEFIPCLAKAGRFQEITIKALNDVGAQYFCWLRPNEELTTESGKKRRFCPNGGFVYLFHKNTYAGSKEEMEKDCYFSVTSGDDYVAEVAEEKVEHDVAVLHESFALVRKKIDLLNNLMDQTESKKGRNLEVNAWTIRDVGVWLDSVELHGYKNLFEERMIDGETLLDLDQENIKDLVPSYHVKKVMRQIEKLQLKSSVHHDDEIERLQSQIEDLQSCVVCFASDKNSVIKPCGHICCCMECATKLNTCPLCRVNVESFLKVYLG